MPTLLALREPYRGFGVRGVVRKGESLQKTKVCNLYCSVECTHTKLHILLFQKRLAPWHKPSDSKRRSRGRKGCFRVPTPPSEVGTGWHRLAQDFAFCANPPLRLAQKATGVDRESVPTPFLELCQLCQPFRVFQTLWGIWCVCVVAKKWHVTKVAKELGDESLHANSLG